MVAPHRGAWIETLFLLLLYILVSKKVAPHRGAWIETGIFEFAGQRYYVAPHRGAWIETL